MDRAELLKKIASFPLIARGLADEILAGDYASIFRGQGIEFDELRRYERGDDIRSVDWNASARFGAPFVKLYREEREMGVFLVTDVSASMRGRCAEQGILAAALIALSAAAAGQRVGALFFDDGIRRVFPPRKGRVMNLIGAMLDERGTDEKDGGEDTGGRDGGEDTGGRSSDLGAALAGVQRLLKKRGFVVVVSDFYCLEGVDRKSTDRFSGRGWETELLSLARRHDVIAVRIHSDDAAPRRGLFALEDPETGARATISAAFRGVAASWKEWHAARKRRWEEACRKAGASYLDLSVDDDAAAVLLRFFGERKKP